jgi:Phosphoribosylformylglycinamidine (FGAM) synthase
VAIAINASDNIRQNWLDRPLVAFLSIDDSRSWYSESCSSEATKRISEKRIILMNTKYHSRIYVTLRASVLDPAGVAVASGLKQLGYETVEGIRLSPPPQKPKHAKN